MAKTKAKFKKSLLRLKETEKKLEDSDRKVKEFEEKTVKMVEMVQKSKAEEREKVEALERELSAAKVSTEFAATISLVFQFKKKRKVSVITK